MVKPIETVYRGCRFRSRLEARWAVFLDALEIPYEYEVEGYDLGNGKRYLPDFWLPQHQFWIEVKGKYPTWEEQENLRLVAEATNAVKAVIFFDYVPKPPFPIFGPTSGLLIHDGWDEKYCWCMCPDCGACGIEFEGRSDRLPCKVCQTCTILANTNNFNAENYQRIYNNGGCRKHGFKLKVGGCPVGAYNWDKGYNSDPPRLVRAYKAATMARFEFGESP